MRNVRKNENPGLKTEGHLTMSAPLEAYSLPTTIA